jgi:glycosyltransferase involved in cell wall biosynthesis
VPLLSVVIPVKDPDYTRLRRCLESFHALSGAADIQIVLVHTGPLRSDSLGQFAGLHSLRVVGCELRGIYSACNAGIPPAQGRFLLFFGHDDIALPEMDQALARLACIGQSRVLLACAVYVQGIGVRRPSRWRQGIVFRNWGHQGIFYSASLLHAASYDTRYTLRADHRLNIALLADRTVHCVKLPAVVCYFSRGGYSTQHIIDRHFDAEQAGIAALEFGWIWGVAVSTLIPLLRMFRRVLRKLARAARTIRRGADR